MNKSHKPPSDLEFMLDPYKWPHLTLPLKRLLPPGTPGYGKEPRAAVLTGVNPDTKQVYFVPHNMWDIKSPDDLKNGKWVDPAELIRDGWRVD